MFALFWFKFVPTGHIFYTHDLERDHSFISDITPAERVEIEDGQARIMGDPAYFTLRVPRPFRIATVILRYKFPSEKLDIMELGILADSLNWRYRTKPVENKMIDHLSLVWNRIEEDGSLLLQRENKYDSLEEFMNTPPSGEEIALYNYDWDKKYSLPGYEPDQENSSIRAPLRGSYQFYTYIKEEPLNVEFKFWDINENEEKDDFTINLYYEDKLISSKDVQGDGIEEDTGEINILGQAGFDIQDLAEGVYRIEVAANDDIITERIDSQQSKISFRGNLKLAKTDILKGDFEGVYPLKLYTDGLEVHAKTIHPSSRQSLSINEDRQVLNIEETYKKFSQEIEPGAGKKSNIGIEKSGLILNSDGVFSFTADSLFNPGFKKLRSARSLTDNINYILADYQSGEKDNGWQVKEIKFDLGSAYSEDNKYKFLVSVPGLENDDDIDDGVVIEEIKVELEGETVPEVLMRKLEIRN